MSPWFVEAIESGEIILCDPVVLELLRHVPTRDYERVEQYLRGFRQTAMTSSDWQVARQVQRELARSTAQDHRKVTIADLLIAAAAQRTGLTLVHYDDDFDRIKQVTGQPMRWLAPRGAPVTGSR